MHFPASGVRVQKVAEKFNAHRRVISNGERAESADGKSGEVIAGNTLPVWLLYRGHVLCPARVRVLLLVLDPASADGFQRR